LIRRDGMDASMDLNSLDSRKLDRGLYLL